MESVQFHQKPLAREGNWRFQHSNFIPQFHRWNYIDEISDTPADEIHKVLRTWSPGALVWQWRRGASWRPWVPSLKWIRGERFIKERAYKLELQFGINPTRMPNCSWIKFTSKRAWDKPNEIKLRFDISDPHSKIHAVRNWNGMSGSQIHSDPNDIEQRRTGNEFQIQNANLT